MFGMLDKLNRINISFSYVLCFFQTRYIVSVKCLYLSYAEDNKPMSEVVYFYLRILSHLKKARGYKNIKKTIFPILNKAIKDLFIQQFCLIQHFNLAFQTQPYSFWLLNDNLPQKLGNLQNLLDLYFDGTDVR